MIVHHLFRRGSIWFVDFRFQDRRYKISTRARIKADAQRIGEFLVRQTVEKVMGGGQFKLSELVDRYVSHARAVNVPGWFAMKEMYLGRFAKFMGDRPLSEVTPYDCQRYFQHAATFGKSSSNSQLAVLKNMFSLAVEWEMMAKSPMAKLKAFHIPSRQRFLSDDEIRKLLDAATYIQAHAHTDCQRSFYPFIKTALLTGMRKGELMGLRWMDFRDDFVIIKHPKEKKEKLVPIPPLLKKELLKLNMGQEFIFQGVTNNSLHRTWHTACRRAGIRDATPHSMRHRFASVWAQSGTNLVALQQTLGHSSLSQTAKYAHSNRQDQLAAVTRMEQNLAGTKTGPKNKAKNG